MLVKAMEWANAITGLMLLLVGIIYFMKGELLNGLNWSIFGCMYLAMGCYGEVHTNNWLGRFRIAGAFLGLALALGLLWYILSS